MKNWTFCGSEKVPAGAGGSEAEWSCPNTGDGCNGILSLNDVHQGQRVITRSQLVYQPKRDGEKKSQEGNRPLHSLCAALLPQFQRWRARSEKTVSPFSRLTLRDKWNKHVINRSSDSTSAFEPQGVTFTLEQCDIFEFYSDGNKYSHFPSVLSQHTIPNL